MSIFNYTAVDYAGRKIKGQLEAKDRASVISTLRKNQVIIISIRQLKEKELKRGRVKIEDLVVFTRQLSALVKAGIPLMKGLNVLSSQIENDYLKGIISFVATKIESGSSLSDALSNYPNIFNPLYINMIKAGEFSGALDVILERLAIHLESINSLNRKVKAALTYPIAIIIVSVLITLLIFLKVVPGFKAIFDTLQAQLPLPTLIVFKISEVLQKYFLFVAIFFGLVVFGLKQILSMRRFKLAWDRIKLNLPIIGPVARKVIIARLTRTLATLLKSGVSILSALDIGGKATGNKMLEDVLNNVSNQVSKGEHIGEALAATKIFPPLVVNLIAVGEESGDIVSMMDKVASFYEEEVDNKVSSLTSLIEPFIIIFLGGLIGGIALAMFLPIFQLTRMVGR